VLRAVLDANVLVSAFLRPEGPSGKILRSFLVERSFELILTVEILAEVQRALQYSRVKKYLAVTDEEIEVRLASLGVLADVVSGEVKVEVVSDDPDDDKYVGAALQGRAGFVVSGDAHLQKVKEYQGIRFVSPREFLKLLEASQPSGDLEPLPP
jgi:putative PIN family toxin of toxin-antitoxin system